jgi:hypothetical protein
LLGLWHGCSQHRQPRNLGFRYRALATACETGIVFVADIFAIAFTIVRIKRVYQ